MTEIRFPNSKLNINVSDVGGIQMSNNGEFNISTGNEYKFKINSTDKTTITNTTLKTNTISELTSGSGVTIDNTLIKDSPLVSINTNVVKTNTINETSSGSGVTIDGVLCKDNFINTDKISEKTASNNIEIANYTKLSGNTLFIYKVVGTISNITGDGTLYSIVYNTNVINQGSAFNGTTFTAPITGIYEFTLTLTISGLTGSHTELQILIAATGATDSVYYNNPNTITGTFGITGTLIVKLNTNDTAVAQVIAYNGTKVVSIVTSRFTGRLITTI
jgi:hypothetical protein